MFAQDRHAGIDIAPGGGRNHGFSYALRVLTDE
ncbi:MAG: hypothetical protein ACI83P_000598, partial [Janthinobacterium sp.]